MNVNYCVIQVHAVIVLISVYINYFVIVEKHLKNRLYSVEHNRILVETIAKNFCHAITIVLSYVIVMIVNVDNKQKFYANVENKK